MSRLPNMDPFVRLEGNQDDFKGPGRTGRTEQVASFVPPRINTSKAKALRSVANMALCSGTTPAHGRGVSASGGKTHARHLQSIGQAEGCKRQQFDVTCPETDELTCQSDINCYLF